MFLVISYDVPDNKRRTRIAKTLEDYGLRVQYSVFEAHLDSKRLAELRKKLKSLMNEDEDSVRVYGLCDVCREKVKVMGIGTPTKDPQVYIIGGQ